MLRKRIYLLAFLLLPGWAFAQTTQPGSSEKPATHPTKITALTPPAYTPTEARMASFAQRMQARAQSLVGAVPFHNVGPTIMSGRVVDVAVNPADPTVFYVAYASGGLWHTANNGITFDPLFEGEATMTIGDIAVDWTRGTIWVGTGENNSSRSSYSGTGMYRSDDGGQTWQHLGLGETHHIGRIILHPTDPQTVWVAALGHLYSSNAERGLYKTTDGGQTWRQTLHVGADAGIIDLIADPSNPDVLYASSWYRTRRSWDFVESGEESGIYKSTDGGETWHLITGAGSGFTTGDGVGRIGLAVFPGNPNTLYASVDSQYRMEPEDEVETAAPTGLTREQFRTMSKAEFLALDPADVTTYLRRNRFPARYTVDTITEMIENDEIVPRALDDFLSDANADLFNRPIIGAEVYRSDDAGRTWRKTSEGIIDVMYFSYGYYFGEIRVSPHNADHIYLLGVQILKSEDAGRTWASIGRENVHADHHALWVNPQKPGHLINGNDGGLNISYDDGKNWFKANNPSVGQFYAIGFDMAEPYNVYGGLQDNGVWMGPSTYRANMNWHGEGQYPYRRIFGGDGMQVQVDFRDNTTVYTGLQFGNYARLHTDSGERQTVRPNHVLGERPLRFNWQTPIHLSRHHQDILYMGSNKFHRSMDQGATFETLSDDLTRGGQAGDVPFGTLTTIDESPLKFGLIYVGSDDGLIHMTPDGGHTWTRISDDLPEGLWVSHVDASHHNEGVVYATLNGYRWDHFDAYVYRSSDYGQTWTRLGADLPLEPLNVVTEDPVNPDVVYVGSDHGLYVSLDGGTSFMEMHNGLPHVAVHDLEVHPRENELIVGTHGRSIYIGDVSQIQQLTREQQAEILHLFTVASVRHSSFWGRNGFQPNIAITFWTQNAGAATLTVQDENGTALKTLNLDATRGLNFLTYHATKDDDTYLSAGRYTLVLQVGGETVSGPLQIRGNRGQN